MKALVNVAGWVGTLLILSAYVLSSNGRLQGRSRVYQWMNVLGGAGLIVNNQWNRAYPAVVLNVVWIAVGLYALVRHGRSSSGTPESE